MTRALVLCLLLLLGACTANPTPTPLPTLPPPTNTPTVSPTLPPTSVPARVTPAAQPTLLPALAAATLPRLTERTFASGEIQTTETLTVTETFTTSLVTYTSEGLEITGLLNVPRGEGKFPAVVLAHGYVPPSQYYRGLDAQAFGEELARNGYVTLVPDLRGYMESDHGLNVFLSGWIADVINAGDALKRDPRVDAENIGLWGHSMGGGIATRVMVVSDVYDAVVLYAPISADIADMFLDPFGGEPEGVTQELIEGVIAALDDPTFRAAVSPIYFLQQTRAPVSIHVGTADKVTPKEWSRAIRDGLKEANREVEYFDYQGQGHSIGGSAQEEFYGRMIDFFDRNLK